jgi:hypothetical protein
VNLPQLRDILVNGLGISNDPDFQSKVEEILQTLESAKSNSTNLTEFATTLKDHFTGLNENVLSEKLPALLARY